MQYQTGFITNRLIHRFILESTFSSETNVYEVVLPAYSDNLGLDIEIRLKNRQTGKF